MIKKARNLFFHPTVRNLGVVTVGNIFNAALGFAAIIFISRVLGPERFGVFSVVFGVFVLISKLGDLGSNASAVKFISFYRSAEDEKSEKQVAGFFLGITYIFIIFTFVFIAPFYNQIANLLNVGQYAIWVLLAIISGAGLIMFNTYSVIFQALEKFSDYIYSYSVTSAFKIISVLVLIPLTLLTLPTSLSIYFISPALGYLVFLALLKYKYHYTIKANLSRSALQKMSPFIYFMAISSIVGALSEQIGIFFSNIFFTSFDTGLLASASRVSAIFVVIAGSVGSVLVPRASRYTDTKNIKSFAKKTLLLGLMLFMLCVPVILFPKFIILITSGSEYFQAQNLLILLTVASAISVLRASFGSVFYGLGNGKFFVYTSVINLLLEVPLTLFLADVFGLVGIAWTRLLLQTFLFGFTVVFFVIKLKNR